MAEYRSSDADPTVADLNCTDPCRRYGVGMSPLMPTSFRWSDLARRHDWRRGVSNTCSYMPAAMYASNL